MPWPKGTPHTRAMIAKRAEAQPQRLMRHAGFRLAVRLGLVTIEEKPVQFYFEVA